MSYVPPPSGQPYYQQGYPPQTTQQPQQLAAQPRGGSCFGTGLLVTGVVGTILVQLIVLLVVFSGALTTGLQEQEFIALGCMLTLGAIAVCILPGMFLVYRGSTSEPPR